MAKNIEKTIATNKKAYHDFFIEDTFEAGIVLTGSEVKSARLGQVNLKDSYAVIKNGELLLLGLHISPYEKGSFFNPDARRTRKLLMHKKEIQKLRQKTEQKGYTIVVTKLYFKQALLKAEVALARGKELHDKRETLKRRQQEMDIKRALARA